MSWRKFVGEKQSLVLPYFGGATVTAEGRRLRVPAEVPAGWWRFDVTGRVATAAEPAEPPDLSALSRERGHFARGWLFLGGAREERVRLLPAEEPPLLSPISTRRWHSGDLLFENLEFETEAEELARRALEERRPLAGVKGVGASLRAAYGFALTTIVSTELGIAISPRELHGKALSLAERGTEAAVEQLRALEAERALERVRLEAWQRTRHHPAVTVQRRAAERSPEDRVFRALDVAGATLLSQRDLGNGSLEVTFSFWGERFISVVDARTLQVYDAGICLSGEDRLVTLESLPSVIREAIDTSRLVITRH